MGTDAAAGGLTVAEANPGPAARDEPIALARAVKEEARRVGFDLAGVAAAGAPWGLDEFQQWLRRGYDGEMTYLARRAEAYADPDHVLSGVRSVVMLAAVYRTSDPAPAGAQAGRVSRYAWMDDDYHATLRARLARLADFLHAQRPGCRTRGVVDTAPLLERDFARRAGLGWFGKNTMLINKRQGSWFFLAALLTDAILEPDAPHETSHCGTCTRCLDACPTQAFPEPYVLDARRCLSYLTIELGGPIPEPLRAGIGEWVFGCDICQDVCPWNRSSQRQQERQPDPAFEPRADLNPLDLVELLGIDEQGFRERFGHTALARPGRAGLLRNAAVVLGNRREAQALPALARALCDVEPLVRGAAAWALGQIGGADASAALTARRDEEADPDVLSEIDQALQSAPLPQREPPATG
jgi:epoxyqueuosine reductase